MAQEKVKMAVYSLRLLPREIVDLRAQAKIKQIKPTAYARLLILRGLREDNPRLTDPSPR